MGKETKKKKLSEKKTHTTFYVEHSEKEEKV